MAELKSLIVNGVTRLNNTGYAKNLYADKHITNGGTNAQYVKGDGTLGNIADFAKVGVSYWANLKISDSSSTTTNPTFGTITMGTEGPTFIAKNTYSFINTNSNDISFGYGYAQNSKDVYYDGYNIHFRTGATPTERAIITSDGYFGIGTSSPTHKLHVNNTGNVWTSIINAV